MDLGLSDFRYENSKLQNKFSKTFDTYVHRLRKFEGNLTEI